MNTRAFSRFLVRFAVLGLSCGLFLSALRAAEAESPRRLVGFDRLSYFLYKEQPQDAPPKAGIPESLWSLDGQDIVLEGFMLPLRVEKGKAVDFMLLRNQTACCYGGIPSVNEWVLVQAADGGAPIVMDVPIRCSGRFSVGARFENGLLTGIYFMSNGKLSHP